MFGKSRQNGSILKIFEDLFGELEQNSHTRLAELDANISTKKKLSYEDIQQYLIALKSEITSIRDIVFRLNVLDTALDHVRKIAQAKFSKRLSELKFKYNFLMYEVTTRAMKIAELEHLTLINKTTANPNKQELVQDILWMKIDERTPEQHEYWKNVYALLDT